MKLDIGLNYEDSVELLINKIRELEVTFKLLGLLYVDDSDYESSMGRNIHSYYFGYDHGFKLLYSKDMLTLENFEYSRHSEEDMHYFLVDRFSKALEYIELVKESA